MNNFLSENSYEILNKVKETQKEIWKFFFFSFFKENN